MIYCTFVFIFISDWPSTAFVVLIITKFETLQSSNDAEVRKTGFYLQGNFSRKWWDIILFIILISFVHFIMWKDQAVVLKRKSSPLNFLRYRAVSNLHRLLPGPVGAQCILWKPETFAILNINGIKVWRNFKILFSSIYLLYLEIIHPPMALCF